MEYKGFADFLENAFLGARPHELSVCFTDGNLGNHRRIAVASRQEALNLCLELGVNVVITEESLDKARQFFIDNCQSQINAAHSPATGRIAV